MTENMSVGYVNIRDAPPDYRSTSDTASANEPLIMIPIRKEIRQVEERQHRSRSVKRSVFCFSVGFLSCVIAAAVGIFIWKNYGQTYFETEFVECQKRIVGHYEGSDGIKITETQIEKLTHIIYCGIKMKPDGKVEFKNDELRLLFLDMKNKTQTMNANTKIMFSTDSHFPNNEELAPVMSESKLRKIWIDSISSFILEYHLDGVELYYRWPGSKEDKDNFVFFARELRYKLESVRRTTRRQTPYIISVYAPPYSWAVKGETLISDLLPSVDFFNVETDNFNAPWHETGGTGPLSPLYSNNQKSIDSTMKAYTCTTKLPNRFNIVVPFRGLFWENVEYPLENEEQNRTVRMKNESGEVLGWRTFKKKWDLSSASWDDKSETPYIWNPKNRSLLTFDNERSLKEKMMYMISKNLGGIAITSVEQDDDSNTLLNALTSIDVCPGGPKFKKNEVNYYCE